MVPDGDPARAPGATARRGKLRRYPGLKEEYYLADFEPDAAVLDELGARSRPAAGRRAHAARGVAVPPLRDDLFADVLARLRGDAGSAGRAAPHARAARASSRGGFIVPERAIDAQSLIAYADLVICAGGTMNREAVALGTPVWTTFEGRLGAVDERLIAEGRLRRLQRAGEIDLRSASTRRRRARAPRPAAACRSAVHPHGRLTSGLNPERQSADHQGDRARLHATAVDSPFPLPPPTMSVKASVVVVTYGQRAVTERGLDALAAALGEQLGRSWELVLVDNASPDDTPALLRQWSDRAEVLLLQHNLNFAGGCNAGAARARGDVLVFLNNDTEVVPGALEALVAQVAEPGVAIAGPRLLFPDGTIQHAGVGFLRNALGVMPQHVFHHQDGLLPAAARHLRARLRDGGLPGHPARRVRAARRLRRGVPQRPGRRRPLPSRPDGRPPGRLSRRHRLRARRGRIAGRRERPVGHARTARRDALQ